jgi:hypothetical protein
MSDQILSWLQKWYSNHCNGDWEHGNSVHIGTLDNPGWSISINLDDTELESKLFLKIKIERSETDWLTCFVENKKFEGRCGPYNLLEVLHIFRDWVENSDER